MEKEEDINSMNFDEKLTFYTEKLKEALDSYENEHPEWPTECLFWIMGNCLRHLKKYLESPDEHEISWSNPFAELHFPVDCEWITKDGEQTFQLNSGNLTPENLEDKEVAVKTLTQIMVRQIEIVTLQEATHFTAYAQDGDTYRPMLGPDDIARLKSIKSDDERNAELRNLLQPCSFGAGTIEIPENMQDGEIIPDTVALQLSKINPPLVSVPLPLGSVGSQVITVFEIHPLIVNFSLKKAYFPITIGLTILLQDAPSAENFEHPPWVQFTEWSDKVRKQLWESLFSEIDKQISKLGPSTPTEVDEAILVVNAQIRIRKGEANLEEVQRMALEQLQAIGSIIELDMHTRSNLDKTIDYSRALQALKEIDAAQSSQGKGKSLEDLMSYLFSSIDGFSISERSHSKTEEIDLFIVNNGDHPSFRREGQIILVECKLWSKKCGKDEFVLFHQKMANRSGRCTLGFLISWNGFANTIPMEMLRGSRETLLIVPLDGNQIRMAIESGNFLDCILKAMNKALLK